jgi:multidrug efflux pump subunit AcrB
MLTGTLVTAVGFLPVGLANSAVGEYAGGIFWVVGIALIASWFVAVIFTPYLGVKLLPKNLAAHGHADPHAIYETRLYRVLRGIIDLCVRWRKTTVLATVGIFVAAVMGFGSVQQQFFPLSERPELFFQMRLPEGTAIGTTLQTAKKAEALLGNDPDVATATTYIGQGSPRFWLGLNPQLPNESFAEIVIVSKDVEARERIKARLDKALAEGALSQARVRVDRFSFGPPVGFPVQFRVVGSDPAKVRDVAFQVRDTMRANPNVVDPHLEWNEMTPSVRIVVDQERARALGLDPQGVSQTLQTLISGLTVTAVRSGTERVDVVPARRRPSASISAASATSRWCHAMACRCRSRRSAASSTPTRSRSSGGATATCRSPCAPTWSTACSRPTSRTRSGRSCNRSATGSSPATASRSAGAVEESSRATPRSSPSSP